MIKIKIADIKIIVDPINSDFFNKRFEEYLDDFTGAPDLEIKTTIVDKISAPDGKLIKKNKYAKVFEQEDKTRILALPFKESENFSRLLKYSEDWSVAEIVLLDRIYYDKLTVCEMEYMLINEVFCNRLTILGGLCLHSSSISIDGIGICFSANSGTGKSTQAGLWSDYFKQRVVRVNDDRPVLRIENDEIMMYGTPFSGKTDINKNLRVPLKAIVFLTQSATNKIEKSNVSKAIFNLTEQVPRPFFDEKITLCNIDFIEEILKRVEIFNLECDISFDAVKVAYDRIFKK